VPDVLTYTENHIIDGVLFSIYADSPCNSTIFYYSVIDSATVPGVIQYIVSIPSSTGTCQEELIFIVERYAPLPESADEDPFLGYADFGTGLWSSKRVSVLEVIMVNDIICHAIGRPWSTGIILLKALDQVSLYFAVGFSRLICFLEFWTKTSGLYGAVIVSMQITACRIVEYCCTIFFWQCKSSSS
jgi:hypothetical protein